MSSVIAARYFNCIGCLSEVNSQIQNNNFKQVMKTSIGIEMYFPLVIVWNGSRGMERQSRFERALFRPVIRDHNKKERKKK